MARVRGRWKQVRFGVPDVSLTGLVGVVVLAELIGRLGVVEVLDEQVGAIKQRDRGVSVGQVLTALAQCQLLGGQGLVGLDRQRADVAGKQLSAVPGVPSTTAVGLARRFGPEQLCGIESGMARLLLRAVGMLPALRRAQLCGVDPTIDMDSPDVEVDGPGKRGVAYNYKGQRAGRAHLAGWAQAGVVLAGELLAGNDDGRPRAADLLRRALAAMPGEVTGRARVRADAGYCTAELAYAANDLGCDYAITAKRNIAMWRAYASIGEHEWVPARDMPGAQVATVDHAPAGWPPEAYTIVRRVRIRAENLSTEPRARRRRTIPAEQLTLALDGALDPV